MAIATCPYCQFTYDDLYKWTICPHNILEASPDAPRGTNRGYCQEHDLFNCTFDHEGK